MKTTVSEHQKINRYKQYLYSIQIPVRQKINNYKKFSVNYKAILCTSMKLFFLIYVYTHPSDVFLLLPSPRTISK